MHEPDTITAGFESIHLPATTIETVKTFTIPLLRQRSEFEYGVLADNIMPGMLLYGPPGTGKTQLVKAMAKHCGARVLHVSGGNIFGHWVGDSEKTVAASFSLARKLSPCILFVDEADSFLHRRGDLYEGKTGRLVLSQFLSEWDGFDSDASKPVIVVLATNRPSELDDAILRRAPKKIAVGIPTWEDRLAILKIHLQDECLDPDVNLESIAKKTGKLTGSDLKNICIAAAYACIYENYFRINEVDNKALAMKHTGMVVAPDHQRRILAARHFEKAMGDIKPSVTSSMSLNMEDFGNSLKQGRSKGRSIAATTKAITVPSSRVPM